MSQNNTVYDVITKRIIEKLEQGTIPWQRPWNAAGSMPKNLISKKEYRGINVFLLGCQQYASPYWLTYKQAQDLGGNVRKGEKGSPVVFWKWLKAEDKDTQEEKTIPLCRYYTVFNVAQCEGIEAPATETVTREFTPIQECEQVISGMPNPPRMSSLEALAYYRPSTDTVNMPERVLFKSDEGFYATAFHELAHSTGHESRLNRQTLTDLCPFGSTNYSREELVAEMTASFLCGHTGIENAVLDNSASYINGWLSRLRVDSKLVVIAGAQAQKAADFILNRKFEEET
ncbi:MAG TPA: ArdC-like ssDNA-binding domain-containing protein [Acidobacteriota bacterium]|jgi:antirestriction protein ArdC